MPSALTCPICGADDRQETIIGRLRGTETGHVWCRKCDGTYDSNVAAVKAEFLSGRADPSIPKTRDEYRRLFVETNDITGEGNTVYPRFKWDNNAEMQAAIAKDVAAAIRSHTDVERPQILDLGCGNGFTTRGLGRIFGESSVVGVDPSPTVLQLMAEPAIECHQGTIQQVGLQPERFDAVSIIGNLMLHPDPSDTMAEVYNVVKPGGVVVFDVKNIHSFSRLAARRLARMSGRLSRAGLLQRNFVNMRYGLHRGHIGWLCPPDRYEVLATETKSPRLLTFSNRSEYSTGLKGLIWSLADRIDAMRDERSWLQVTVRKR